MLIASHDLHHTHFPDKHMHSFPTAYPKSLRRRSGTHASFDGRKLTRKYSRLFRPTPASPDYYAHTSANMGREDFIRQILNSKEYKILDRLANEADAPVGDAVQQIVDMTMSALPKHQPATRGGPGDIDYNVSLALLELGQTLDPSRHGKLVEFLSELQKKTAVDPSTGKPVDIQGDVLWTGLPSFGYTELETWDERGGEYKGKYHPTYVYI